jgi:fructosamine-3-kinase
MTNSEFQSMSAMHNILPEFVPRPIACGSYSMIPDTHFFLCEFREMSDDLPDPYKFAALLSKLHQKSISPTGKFGFHITTYAGNLPQYVVWEDSWEVFFTKSMRQALDLEIQKKGPSEELEVLSCVLFEKVIPRLLRPLESDGRKVKPSLVHGDLWYANSGIDLNSDQPLVFDACCFFAHNECMFSRKQLGLLMLTLNWKTSLVSGDQLVTGSGTITLLPTIHSPRSRRQRRISSAV